MRGIESLEQFIECLVFRVDKSEILIAVFSFNMGSTLDNCLEYIDRFCPGFDAVLIDDASTDALTLKAIEKWRPRLLDVIVNRSPKTGQKHGNLYANISTICAYARDRGYRYLFMVQDDMQFVRPLNERVLSEYQSIFDSSDKVLQVSTTFFRRGRFEILPSIKAYRHFGLCSYADVGLLDLVRLNESTWQLKDGERVNDEGLHALGYRRILSFTPTVMHVPFPQIYRNGRLRRSLLLRNRGKYGWHSMTDDEIARMDGRDIDVLPTFRRFLRVRNMFAGRLVYWFRKDKRVLA